MRMLKWMCGHIWRNTIKNDVIWSKMKVASVVDKMRETRLGWFRHVKRRCEDIPVRRCEGLVVARVRRGRSRLKNGGRGVDQKGHGTSSAD